VSATVSLTFGANSIIRHRLAGDAEILASGIKHDPIPARLTLCARDCRACAQHFSDQEQIREQSANMD
jgi:hypothetical protein